MSYLVRNPEDRFSRDEAHMYTVSCTSGYLLCTKNSPLTITYAVKILNIRTPEKFAVITLKFEQDGFTIE